MTITLDDVYQITRLPITGKAMFPKGQPEEKTMIDYTARVLGVFPEVVRDEFKHTRANSVSMGWLVRIFSKADRTNPENAGSFVGTNDHVSRAYLLRLIGCTIFCDTSSDKVPVRYVLLFSYIHLCMILIKLLNKLLFNLGICASWRT